MSWLTRLIANTLRLDDDVNNGDNTASPQTTTLIPMTCKTTNPIHHRHRRRNRGVKDDFSDLTHTLTHQFWGIASFLASPTQSDPSPRPQFSDSYDRDASDAVGSPEYAAALRRPEGGVGTGSLCFLVTWRCRSLLRSRRNVEFSSIGSDQEDAVGVTEEVVAFVRDIAMHPEKGCFPLLDDDDDDGLAHQHRVLEFQELNVLTILFSEVNPTPY